MVFDGEGYSPELFEQLWQKRITFRTASENGADLFAQPVRRGPMRPCCWRQRYAATLCRIMLPLSLIDFQITVYSRATYKRCTM